jgi:hypothetical protein
MVPMTSLRAPASAIHASAIDDAIKSNRATLALGSPYLIADA